jgi:hypothetical protein
MIIDDLLIGSIKAWPNSKSISTSETEAFYDIWIDPD